jgi:putative membrane protein
MSTHDTPRRDGATGINDDLTQPGRHLVKLLLSILVIPALALGAGGSPDSSFYKSLAQGGLAEVDLSQLASEKSTNAAVKNFGAMMVKDHSAANEELKTLAASKNITLPSGPGAAAQAKKVELDALSGTSFDKSYVSNQIQAHKDTVSLLQKEISSGQDVDAKALAQKLLPTVQAHLKAIEKIAGSLAIKYS